MQQTNLRGTNEMEEECERLFQTFRIGMNSQWTMWIGTYTFLHCSWWKQYETRDKISVL